MSTHSAGCCTMPVTRAYLRLKHKADGTLPTPPPSPLPARIRQVKKSNPQTLRHIAIVEQLKSPLLQLLGELRNRIYELALSSETPLVFQPGGYRKRSIFSVDATKSPKEPVD
ncbi:hypothetical protein HBI64_185200 [Parastagonospora nodorum]|nr:hypothetical protein HBH46_093290 [Parastagonospora nodorum]KAH6117517.1 hypothetical protein HBI64_185200 [Parastagonospora nodorum]